MNSRVAVAASLSRPALASLVLIAIGLVVGCGDKQDKVATQVAARVDKKEITVHQINAALQQQRDLTPEQADEAGRRALERLIDQELAVQKAVELKVDRSAQVVQAIEMARREIIARAYFDKIGEGATKPSSADIGKYYDDHPELFKERRVYQFQELVIQADAEQVGTLRGQLQVAKNANEFVEYLKASGIKFSAGQVVRSAEQLPLGVLPTLAKMKEGQAMLNPTPGGAQVLVLLSARSQPVDEEQAVKAIERFLLNERKRKIVADDLKALRASAKIVYAGKYAASAPAASHQEASKTGAAASVAAELEPKAVTENPGVKARDGEGEKPADSGAQPSSGVDAASIRKGLGFK